MMIKDLFLRAGFGWRKNHRRFLGLERTGAWAAAPPACRFLLPLVFAVSALQGGVIVVESEESLHRTEGAKVRTYLIDGDRVRIDTVGPEQKESCVFHGDRELMWLIDYERKIYREITKETVEDFRDQRERHLSQVEENVERQLKQLPKDQRKQMEAMIRARAQGEEMQDGASPTQGALTYQKTNRTGTVNQWNCEWFDGVLNGHKRHEICVVDLSKFGLKHKDLTVMRQLADFLEAIDPQQAETFLQAGSQKWKKRKSYPGLPVHRTIYPEGRFIEVKQVRREALNDDLFDLPGDFQKRALVVLEGQRP